MPGKNTTLTVQKPFPLLRLPPEIRNRIWRYSLVKDEGVVIHPYGRQYMMKKIVPSRLRSGKELQSHRDDDKRWINSSSIALVFTSRQLYLEAALIYYSENTFTFENEWHPFQVHEMLQAFVAAIGPQNASSITAAFFATTNASFIQYLFLLPGLKQLTYSAGPKPYTPLHETPYYKKIWLPQISSYTRDHPSVTIKTCGWPV